MAIVMMSMGVPRQMLGLQNVPETAPQLERQLADNPIFRDGRRSPYPRALLPGRAPGGI